jgi:hypothetical protein
MRYPWVVAADTQTGRRFRALVPYLLALAASAALGIAVAWLPTDVAGILAVALCVALAAVVARAGRRRSLTVLGALVYVVGLHWAYVETVVPLYAYAGLIESGVDWPSLVAVTLLAVSPALWLPVAIRRPSEAVLWGLFLMAYIPATVIPMHVLGPSITSVLPLELLLALAFGSLGLLQLVPRGSFRWPGLPDRTFTRLMVGMSLVSIPYLVIVFQPTSLPDIGAVYEARASFTAVARSSPLAGYIVSWLTNVIYPFVIAMGMARSQRSVFALGIFGQLLIYAITGFKGTLFSIVLLPVLFLAIRYGPRIFGAVLSWATVGILAVSVAATAVTGSSLVLALFVTRVMVIPGQLTGYYYDFFTTHPTYMLSHSFLRFLFDQPYDLDPPYLIGMLYEHKVTDANANIWADAMANFGLAGIIPFTLLLGLVLVLLDVVASGRDIRVIGTVVAFAAVSLLANGALFTQLLTGGFGLTVVLAALMPRLLPGPETGSGTTPAIPASATSPASATGPPPAGP